MWPARGLLFVLLWMLAPLAACDLLAPSPDDVSGTVEFVNFDALGNVVLRFDVDGNPLDAHGGEIRLFGDTYYLYGETYACGYQWLLQEPVAFCGFRVYSSPNLVDWTDHGLLFDVDSWEPWQARCHWYTSGCFRPHVLHNEATGKYVLWVNGYADPVNYYVLESDTPTGPFTERAIPELAINSDAEPGRTNNGDQNLFLDDDGTGYIVYTEWRTGRGDLVVERLTSDFLSGTGDYVRVGTSGSESPSMFKRDGRYYITASTPPNGGYATSVTSYVTATSPLGPWSKPIEISSNSCGGQPFHVSALPSVTGEDWFLYQSDLWIGGAEPPGDRNQAPAGLYWAPLRFDRSGRIERIRCARTVEAPAVLQDPSPDAGEHWRLVCDVGPSPGGAIQREIRFAAERGGRLEEVRINAYQRHSPDAPLHVEVLSRGEGGSAEVIAALEYEPQPDNWIDFPEIAWTARVLTIPVDLVVERDQEFAVRLRTDASVGCYGLAVRDDLEVEGTHSYVRSGNRGWQAEPIRKVRYGFRISEPPV